MKQLRCLLLLLLSLALFLAGGLLGRDSLTVSHESGCTLWLPPAHESRGTPAVILCGAAQGPAPELCRRGYAVAVVKQSEDIESAYALLESEKQINARLLALIAVGEKAGDKVLAYARSARHPINALVLWRCSADDTEGLCDVLTIDQAQAELTGYFAEGSAREDVPYTNRRNATEKTISWIGSTLGHPRDGVLADDELIYPYANVCRVLGAVAALGAVWFGHRKKEEVTP